MSSISTINNPVEKILDLDVELKNMIIESIKHAFKDDGDSEKKIVESIRKKLEDKAEGKWNVIMGKDFGTHIVHKSRRYAFIQVGELNILIWQSS